MGIVDLFDEQRANLSGINAQNGVYLGQVLQAAEIEVNEEGTVASAASGERKHIACFLLSCLHWGWYVYTFEHLKILKNRLKIRKKLVKPRW